MDCQTELEMFCRSMLHPFVFMCDYNMCKKCLEDGVKDSPNKVGKTALHYAACFGYRDIVELLISKNVDINTKDILGLTPLDFAASNGHKEIVSILLRNNARVSMRSILKITSEQKLQQPHYIEMFRDILLAASLQNEPTNNVKNENVSLLIPHLAQPRQTASSSQTISSISQTTNSNGFVEKVTFSKPTNNVKNENVSLLIPHLAQPRQTASSSQTISSISQTTNSNGFVEKVTFSAMNVWTVQGNENVFWGMSNSTTSSSGTSSSFSYSKTSNSNGLVELGTHSPMDAWTVEANENDFLEMPSVFSFAHPQQITSPSESNSSISYSQTSNGLNVCAVEPNENVFWGMPNLSLSEGSSSFLYSQTLNDNDLVEQGTCLAMYVGNDESTENREEYMMNSDGLLSPTNSESDDFVLDDLSTFL